jgi:urease accessory protein UreE
MTSPDVHVSVRALQAEAIIVEQATLSEMMRFALALGISRRA